MNRFLVYLSQTIVRNRDVLHAILKDLNQLGPTLEVDPYLCVIETERRVDAVQGVIFARTSDAFSNVQKPTAFFVATVEGIGGSGDEYFTEIRLLNEKRPT
jgi:hypothetical protein